ncbi:diadenylate cyclase CdaA [Thermodesulfobacteriota bacterium]
MQLFAIMSDMRLQDVLDILFLSTVAYYLYLWFHGTKAYNALVGLLVFGAVFTIARAWGLFLTTWVFKVLWQVLVILLVVLFQTEIRQVLEKVTPLIRIGFRKKAKSESWLDEFSEAVFSLARRKIGALIILERTEKVREWTTAGTSLEAEPGKEILTSIFQKDSPLHDGAIVIRDGHIIEVASYLPLSPEEGLPKTWGTRHRAALGLSERCDAWVVIISEERGEVSVAGGGKMYNIKSKEELAQHISDVFKTTSSQEKTWKEHARYFATHNWRPKLASFAIVCVLWLLLAGQQDFEISFDVPINTKNLPDNMEIVSPLNPNIEVTVRGLRKDASTLDEKSITATLDLSHARTGKAVFPLSSENIFIPVERLHIIRIKPSRIDFTFKRLSRK